MGRSGCYWLLVCLVAFGCTVGATAGRAGAGRSSPALGIVTLGDSVPRGTNCRCTPYPRLVAQRIATSSGRKVRALNDSVAGYTTSNVLQQLETNNAVIGRIRSADAVEIEIGANDIPYRASCGTGMSCYAAGVAPMRQRLGRIVRRVRALAGTHRVDIVLLDYWSVWLGGKYASAKGSAYVSTAEELTDRVNNAIRSVAAATGSGYVDLRAAFKGPTYTDDETHYLASDGDHPNALGHSKIADAAEAAIRRALHL